MSKYVILIKREPEGILSSATEYRICDTVEEVQKFIEYQESVKSEPYLLCRPNVHSYSIYELGKEIDFEIVEEKEEEVITKVTKKAVVKYVK